MSYDPNKPYYRCTIIRGKTQSKMDDLLPAYAAIIHSICPCDKKSFDGEFEDNISKLLFKKTYDSLSDSNKKSVNNHCTEIAGKLFGLYKQRDGYIYETPSCIKLVADNDQPAFFKNLCYNFQFPNGTQKISTIQKRVQDQIRFKPFHFTIALLLLAEQSSIYLTKKEIGYYALGSKDVLKGIASPNEVLCTIIANRKAKTEKQLPSGSNYNQHINEQLNLLELANLIRVSNSVIRLNMKENKILDLFIKEATTPLCFDFSKFDLSSSESSKKMYADWGDYYGNVNIDQSILETKLSALSTQDDEKPADSDEPTKTEIGDVGERLVFELEKDRVKKTHPRLLNKVLLLGSQKGIGYDISSVEAAENSNDPEFARFIEVKTTKRITTPNKNDHELVDAINLTRKEWVAAKQHRNSYNIYRVYFTPTGRVIWKINNPYKKEEDGIITVTPLCYRMDFTTDAIDGEYLHA